MILQHADGLHFSGSSNHLVVKNLTESPLIVSGTIYPVGASTPGKTIALAQKFLAAHAAQEMELPAEGDPSTLDGAAIRLDSSGAKGSFVASYSSHDRSSQITRSVPFK